MLLTLFYFIVALFLLVTVHEFGHFIVARCCGVRVLRFSFGFGKVLTRFYDRKNTEFVWSLFPVGGYVKMLDESEGIVADEEKHLAFNNQTLWKRVIIVLAGPIFNFIFAFSALWLVAIIGMQSLAPMINAVKPGSIADKSGLKAHEEILFIDNNKINSWRDFQYALMPLLGSSRTVKLTVKSINDNHQHSVEMPLAEWHLNTKKPDPLKSLGIEPFIPTIPAIVGEVVKESPASVSDIRPNDKIIKVDGFEVIDWLFLVDYVQARPDRMLDLEILRGKQLTKVKVHSGSHENNHKIEGFLGLRSQKTNWPDNWLRTERANPFKALELAAKQTIQLSSTTFVLMWRLVTGKLSINHVSGPIGIAQGAGDSGRGGVTSYLFFLALVSISLGTLNILPIPMLDGGHLFYYAVEFIRGKPVSERFKVTASYIGIVFLITIMFIALTNDISRLIS